MPFPKGEFVRGRANLAKAESFFSKESGIRLRNNNMWRQKSMQYVFLLTHTLITHCLKSYLQ